MLTAGALDTTFGGTGLVATQPSSHFPTGMSDGSTGVAVQSDLKTVVVGNAYQYDNKAWHLNIAVTRYNTDGSLDPTFGSGGVVYIPADSAANPTFPHAYSVAIQADGKIVVAGDTLVTYSVSKRSTSSAMICSSSGSTPIARSIPHSAAAAISTTPECSGPVASPSSPTTRS